MSKNRFHLSLLNLILLMTAMAMGFAWFASYRNRQLMFTKMSAMEAYTEAMKVEMFSVRAEFGYLTIEDESKVHAVAVPAPQSNTWSFRIFLPEGGTCCIACRVNDLPEINEFPSLSQLPLPNNASKVEGNMVVQGTQGGEYIVTISIFEGSDGDFKYQLHTKRSRDGRSGTGIKSGSTIQYPVGEQHWPLRYNFIKTTGVVSKLKVVDLDEPLLLLDVRAFDETLAPDDSFDGVMMWVQEVKKAR